MKTNKLLLFFTLLLFLLFNNLSFAGWEAVISIIGKDMGGQFKKDIKLGIGADEILLSAPPSPPQFSCNIFMPDENWKNRLITNIQKKGLDSYLWIIAANAKGNVGPITDAVSHIKWNSSDFEKNKFELRQGWDGQGEIIISDMSAASELEIVGGNYDQYFTLVMK